MAVTYNPGIVTDGLVLCLDAANRKSYPGTGLTFGDMSGNSNTANLVNGTTFTNEVGGAFVFDGSDDYINVAETVNLTPQVLTVDIFAKINSDTNTTSVSGLQFLVFRQNTRVSNYEGYLLTYNESGRNVIAYTTNSGGGSSSTSTFNNSMPLGKITHICGVFNTNTMSIYCNGAIHTSAAKSTGIDYNATHTLKLGRAVAVGTGFDCSLNGSIYSVKIYNRALSSGEISQNFNALRGRFGI